MMGIFTSRDRNQCDRRLYTDILFQKTKMYANYAPATCLKLGDYGDVTKQGEFIKSGNIFKEYPALEAEVGPHKEDIGNNMSFFGSRTRKKNLSSVVTAEIPALAECSLKLAWDIKKDRHAAIVMIDANHHEIEFEGILHRFIQDKPAVADKAFVTKVYRCSAFARLLTDYGQTGQVYVGFNGNTNTTPSSSTTPTPTPTPSGSASDVGSGVNRQWLTSSQPGTWTTGRYSDGPPHYTPLATLRQITPKDPTIGYRDAMPPVITDKREMEDYIPPWGELDEQGDEVDPETE